MIHSDFGVPSGPSTQEYRGRMSIPLTPRSLPLGGDVTPPSLVRLDGDAGGHVRSYRWSPASVGPLRCDLATQRSSTLLVS